MEKFEYKILALSPVYADALESLFNEVAKEGWIFIETIEAARSNTNTPDIMGIFKRKLDETQTQKEEQA